jgi:hypothetical protein
MYDTEDQSICVDIENLDENMSIQNGPERNLYIAIVVRAIQDWGSKDLNLAVQAKEWIYEPVLEQAEIMSFQFICDVLDLDYYKFKAAIERYVSKNRMSQSLVAI